MDKYKAIKLLESEGWTKADAIRALEVINFNDSPDELTIRRAISIFAGSELIKRQRLQAVQKGMVTKRAKEIEQKNKEHAAKIKQLELAQKQEKEIIESKIESLCSDNQTLGSKLQNLVSQKNELLEVNDQLKKDNKALKNIVDEIKLKLAINTRMLLKYEDSEIRKAVIKLFNSTLG